LRATLPASVRLETRLDDAPLWVDADATQLQQVLMNLCTNAWHALPEGRGRIEVGCTVLPDADPLRSRAVDLQSGPCAHCWVRDDGTGMDAATLARIFDPFFTTKPVGQGTGLGLSVVHGIVRNHRGAVVVDSTPAGGSTFHLLLPLVPRPRPPDLAPVAEPAGDFAPDGGEPTPAIKTIHAGPSAVPAPVASEPASRCVLYVDDDEVMLLMVQRLLEREGHRVWVCSDAVQALAGLRDGTLACDLLVSDFNMPELSGLELVRQLRGLAGLQGLPVVITSGFITDELRLQAAEIGVHALLKKERTLEELAGLVRQVLADVPAPAVADSPLAGLA
jgi:CheY-like chemotaxis protein